MAWAEKEIKGEQRRLKVGIAPGLSREMLLGRDWTGLDELCKTLTSPRDGLSAEN